MFIFYFNKNSAIDPTIKITLRLLEPSTSFSSISLKVTTTFVHCCPPSSWDAFRAVSGSRRFVDCGRVDFLGFLGLGSFLHGRLCSLYGDAEMLLFGSSAWNHIWKVVLFTNRGSVGSNATKNHLDPIGFRVTGWGLIGFGVKGSTHLAREARWRSA